MAVTYSTNLGLALPAQGDWAGTWGTNQNNYITQYLDAAIAGAQTISGTQTAVTLSANNGTSLTQAGLAGTTGSALYQIINCTGNPAGTLTVTVPNTSKTYLVINATSTSQSVVVKAAATTGVTIASGATALVAWNGSDFVVIGSTTAGALAVSGLFTAKNAVVQKSSAIGASNIDLSLGNVFSKTISTTTTFTVSNVPASGSVASFILDLTNGGSATVNWWSGVKWANGLAPGLTTSGRDVLGFFTYDGGSIWNGFLLGSDMK